MRIPYEQLSAMALEEIIKEFVLREGTDYGQREFSIDEKIAQVKGQLQRGEAKVVFDPKDESLNVVRSGEPEE